MTYDTSNKDATEFVKSGIWTHALSQEPKLDSGSLERLALLTLYEEEQYLLFWFIISHIDFPYSLAYFKPNQKIFWISYGPWCRMFP